MALHSTARLALPSALVFSGTGIGLRLRVRFAGSSLDVRLAASEDPSGDAALALRSTQLVSGTVRRRIAGGLERACRPPRLRAGFSAAIPVDAEAVDIARPALLQLAAALRDREPVQSRGVALAQLLLTQPDAPLYRPGYSERLYEAARRSLLALGADRGATASPRMADRGEVPSAPLAERNG